MAATATQNVVDTRELNVVFKSLGERGKEGEKWKEYTDNVLSFILQNLSELLKKTSQNRIMFRPYGSAAEDLKCQEPNDVGDVDIVIYPTADNLMIHDELIEYLPENPMHVRIKGADHPVLQSCLVEDSEYVATSALKSFHPAVFGSSSPFLVDLVSNTLELMSRQEFSSALQCTCQLKNNTNSPAVTLNFAQSFGSMSEQLERLKDQQNLPHLDANAWELLAHFFCTARGIDYTKEHAEAVNDILQLVRDIETTLRKRGLSGDPQMVPIAIQEILSSDRAENIKARIRDVESRLQNETGRIKNLSEEAAVHNNNQQCVTPKQCQENEGESIGDNVSQGTLSEQIVSTANQSKVTEPPEWPEYPEQSSASAEKQSSAEVGETASSEQQPRSLDDNNEGVKNIRERHNLWFEHLFKKGTERREEPSTEKAQLYQRLGGFDFVPAFRSQGWPQVAKEWIERERKWPSPDIITNIIQDGFHLVVKHPKKGGNPDCDFRISFSHAEYLLSQEMNDIQRECYRCLKKYYRGYLSTEPKALVTFHLKNILLQTIEETGAEMWTDGNRAECMMKLFENLMEALTKKFLPHFFVRSYNLFCVDYVENPEILESLAQKVEQIMGSPMQFAKALIQKQVSEEAELIPFIRQGCEETEDTRSTKSKLELPTVPAMETISSQHGILYRYHDLKDIFLAVSKELTDMAFNDADCRLEARDPLEKSLVEDLREIGTNHSIQVEEFPKMFETSWDTVYHKVWVDNEPNMRRRMLHGIQGLVEMWKYILKQDDLAPGNEAAIARRMLDPGVENPFDLSHMIPAGSGMQFILRFINSLEPRPAQQRETDLDDIPLD